MNIKLPLSFFLLASICFSTLAIGQVRIVNNANNTAATNSSAFIDASSNVAVNGNSNLGKGLLFPRTDLTNFTSFGFVGTNGIANNYPTRFDGMIVYNTATSGVAGVGSTQGTLTKGFWYYDNPATGGAPNNPALLNGGTWRPMDTDTVIDGKVTVVENSAVATNLINADNDTVQVIQVPGTTDGTKTTIDLGTTNIAANTVKQFRKALIFDATSGNLVLEATGDYTSATNVLVTGDNMMNLLLPAGTYDVELYYTSN